MAENTVAMKDVPVKAAEEERRELVLQDAEPMDVQHGRQDIVALALQQNADPAVLSKLMDLQERWEANEARKAYTSAMALFKQDCPPVIGKDSTVDFKNKAGVRTHYNYVSLGSLVNKVTSLLGKFGLSSAWQTAQDERGISVTCKITHEKGHSEDVTMTAPPDETGNKNRIQQIGSTVTYLQRYTLFAALGLASGDQDDDGVSSGPRPEPKADPVPEPNNDPVPPAAAKLDDKPKDGFEQLEGCISVKQVKRLFAIAKSTDNDHKPWPDDEIKKLILANGYTHTNEIPKGEVYNSIIGQLEA